MKWDLAIPKIFRLTQEERAANWEKNLPKTVLLVDTARPLDPEAEKFRAEYETEKKRKTTRRIHELRIKKQVVKSGQDTTGKTWNQKYCRWDNDPNATPQETSDMPKLTVTPYAADGKALERGKTSMNANATQEEIDAKIQFAAKRAGKRTVRVEVTDKDGFVSATWTAPEALQAPTATEPTATTESAVSTKKTKTAKKTKAVAAANGAGKKPGVISTILEMLNRATGVTVEEALDRLKTKFPERERDAMRTTCKIQLARHSKSKDKTEGRGLIYYATK